jgi:hypothetical protein
MKVVAIADVDTTGVVHEVVAETAGVSTAGGIGLPANVAAVEWVASGIVDDVAVAEVVSHTHRKRTVAVAATAGAIAIFAH